MKLKEKIKNKLLVNHWSEEIKREKERLIEVREGEPEYE